MSKDSIPLHRKVHPGDIFEIFQESDGLVLSTTEISQQIDWASKSTVFRRLNDMREDGQLRSKKAGDKENAGLVWYPPDKIPDVPQPTPDILKLIYRYPWFSLMTGGVLSIGVGFMFFIPGFFGDGAHWWIIDRDWLVIASFGLSAVGLLAAYIGVGAIIIKTIIGLIKYKI